MELLHKLLMFRKALSIFCLIVGMWIVSLLTIVKEYRRTDVVVTDNENAYKETFAKFRQEFGTNDGSAFEGWLEQLLQSISEDPNKVVSPVIDHIHEATFEYIVQDTNELRLGGFTWDSRFTWIGILQGIHIKRKHPSTPIKTPTITSGLFAINKAFFEKSGCYDREMELWVWLDDYAKYYYKRIGNKKGEYGNVSERIELRKKLNCKPFHWYPQLELPDKYAATCQIYSANDYGLCLDAVISVANYENSVNLITCHCQGSNQFWYYSQTGEILRDDICLDYLYNSITLYFCNNAATQVWLSFEEEDILHM